MESVDYNIIGDSVEFGKIRKRVEFFSTFEVKHCEQRKQNNVSLVVSISKLLKKILFRATKIVIVTK